MALRWLGAAVVTAATILLAEAPVMLAGPVLGLFWGIVAVTIGGLIMTTVVVYLIPTVDPDSKMGLFLGRFRAWWMRQAEDRGRWVRWAYRYGAIVTFLASSVLVGPIITGLLTTVIRGERARISHIIASSVLFATVAVSFYSGLWAIMRR